MYARGFQLRVQLFEANVSFSGVGCDGRRDVVVVSAGTRLPGGLELAPSAGDPGGPCSASSKISVPRILFDIQRLTYNLIELIRRRAMGRASA